MAILLIPIPLRISHALFVNSATDGVIMLRIMIQNIRLCRRRHGKNRVATIPTILSTIFFVTELPVIIR